MEKDLARQLLLALAGNPAIGANGLGVAFRAGVAAWHEQYPGDRQAGAPEGPPMASGRARKPPASDAKRAPKGEASPTVADAFRAWQAIRISKGESASREEFEADIESGAHNYGELLEFLRAD